MPSKDVQALIVTSRNGVRALAASAAYAAARELTIFCVGEGTAEAARQSRISKHVSAGAGTARDLVPLVSEKAEKSGGALLHVAGEHLAFDLTGALIAPGPRCAYADRLPRRGRLSPIVANGAGTRRRPHRCRHTDVAANRRDFCTTCLRSPGLAKAPESCATSVFLSAWRTRLAILPSGRCEVAATPNSQGMLAAIARVATQPTGV